MSLSATLSCLSNICDTCTRRLEHARILSHATSFSPPCPQRPTPPSHLVCDLAHPRTIDQLLDTVSSFDAWYDAAGAHSFVSYHSPLCERLADNGSTHVFLFTGPYFLCRGLCRPHGGETGKVGRGAGGRGGIGWKGRECTRVPFALFPVARFRTLASAHAGRPLLRPAPVALFLKHATHPPPSAAVLDNFSSCSSCIYLCSI